MPDFIKIPDKSKLYQAADTENIRAVVGGINTEHFAPSANISFKMKSGKEQYFLNIVDDIDQVKTVGKAEDWQDNKLKIKDGDVESTFELHPTSLKIERVFYSKPTENPIYRLKFSPGVRFVYQGELTSEEAALGCERPDNVVGSYAVYCDRKHHFIDKSGKTVVNCGTGKLGHLYAPYWTDAEGKIIKGTQDIVGDKLVFTLPPQEWLNRAVLPIKLDPDLGYTTVGSSGYSHADPRAMALLKDENGSYYAMSEDGNLDSVSIYLKNVGGSFTRTISVGVYDDDANAPENLIDSDTFGSVAGDAWNTMEGLTGSLTNGSQYYPAFRFSSGDGKVAYDSDADALVTYHVNPSSLPNPWTSSSTIAWLPSIYLTYTVGSSILPILSNQKRRIAHTNIRR